MSLFSPTTSAAAGRDVHIGPPQLKVLACRALRQRLTVELDHLDKLLAPRRMQRQPSTAALARRRSAAMVIDPSLGGVPNGAAAAGASRIDVSAVSSSPSAGSPLRPRAAIAAFKVGSGRLSSGPRTVAIEPQPLPPAWTALLPPPRQQQQQPAIQPTAVLSTTPRPSPFAAAAALPAPDAECSEQVPFLLLWCIHILACIWICSIVLMVVAEPCRRRADMPVTRLDIECLQLFQI